MFFILSSSSYRASDIVRSLQHQYSIFVAFPIINLGSSTKASSQSVQLSLFGECINRSSIQFSILFCVQINFERIQLVKNIVNLLKTLNLTTEIHTHPYIYFSEI